MNPEHFLSGYYIAFGILTMVGGVIGYVKVKSIISLISGILLGGLLIGASILYPGGPNLALFLGLAASLAIAGKFIPDYIHKKALFPGGLMALLSVISVALTIFVWYLR